MALPYSNTPIPATQASHGLDEIQAILDGIETSALLEKLKAYRWVGNRWRGRVGYSLEAMLRAFLVSFIMNVPSTCALIRRLQDEPSLRSVCGFDALPHRTTFSRFFSRLTDHLNLIESCIATATNQLREYIPDLGSKVAIDSTTIYVHSNPKRRVVSDPEATWTAKAKTGTKDAIEWRFGYKYHLIADADYGIPLYGYLTTASRNDTLELPPLLDAAAETYNWFKPEYVLTDKGYDSQANHHAVLARGAVPVIPKRKLRKTDMLAGIYTDDGVPTCIGQVPMEYVRSDPEQGHLYMCPPEGCHLKDRKGVLYCKDTLWEQPQDNPRLFGVLSRNSPQWKALYSLRQGVERIFKSLKQSRRLEAHCLRGLKKIALHAALAVLVFQATALYHLQAGQAGLMRWQCRKVA